MPEINVRLTKKQVEEIGAGRAVTITLLPPKVARRPRKAEAKDEADLVDASPNIDKLVKAWNESKFIREIAIDESRNNKITPQQVQDYRPTLEAAIAEVGLPNLLRLVKGYFKACEDGRHIWEGSNHGYSHLGGFVRRIINTHKRGTLPWWTNKEFLKVEDKHPDQTVQLADEFAKKFLNRDEYSLTNPSKDYHRFMKAASLIRHLAFDAKWERKIRIVLDILDKDCQGQDWLPTPGRLCNDAFWRLKMPQYLKRMLGA